MNKQSIEELATTILRETAATHPELSTAQVCAIFGYTSAFMLNSVHNHPLWRQLGEVCYSILTDDAKETNEREVGKVSSALRQSDEAHQGEAANGSNDSNN